MAAFPGLASSLAARGPVVLSNLAGATVSVIGARRGMGDGRRPRTALAMAWMSQLAYETRLPDKIRAIGALYGLVEIIGKKRERRGQIRKRA